MNDLYTPLSGRRVLLIEDDRFTIGYLAAAIKAAGAIVVGPFANEAEALAHIPMLDVAPAAAVVAAHLPGGFCATLAAALRDRAIACVFISNRAGVALPAGWEDHELLAKPYASYQVIDALALLLAAPTLNRVSA